jgi:oxygen-dependent protoporphyrinogen oxidase
LDDDRLIAEVEGEVRELAGLSGRATAAHVQRWPDALPQYDVGHLARIDRLRSALRRDAPNLHIGGASLDGVGLAARAKDAERLAHEIRWDAGLTG